MPLVNHQPGQVEHLSTRAALSLYANPRRSLLDVSPHWFIIVALCGLPFLLIGLLIPFFSLGLGPADMAGTTQSRPLFAFTAAPFLAIGTGALIPLLRHTLHVRRRQQLLQAHRHRHAARDYPWNPQRCEDVNYRGPLVPIIVALAIAAFVGPFNVVFTQDVHLNARVIVFMLNIGTLATLGFAISAIVHSLRRGRSRIHLDGFPLELGRRPRITLQPRGMLARANAWHLLLECVFDTDSEDRQSRPLVDVRYSRGFHIQRAAADVGSVHQIELPLPDDPELSSALGEDPPRYWHLVIAPEPSGGIPARFILPVYAPGVHQRQPASPARQSQETANATPAEAATQQPIAPAES